MQIRKQIIILMLCLPVLFLTFFCAKKQLKDKQLLQENGENIFALRYQKMVLITSDKPFSNNSEEQWLVKFLIENSTAVYQTVARPLDVELQILGIFDNINLPISRIISIENKDKIITLENPILVDEEPESVIYTSNLNESIVNNNFLVFELPTDFLVNSNQVLVSYQKENFLQFILGKKQGKQVILPRFVPILTVVGKDAVLEKDLKIKVDFNGLMAGKLHVGKISDFYIEFVDQKSNDNLASWIEIQNPYLLGKNNQGQKVIRDLKRKQDHFVLDPFIWKDFADGTISIVFNQGVVAGIFEKSQYEIHDPEDFKAMLYDPKGFYTQEKDLIFNGSNTQPGEIISKFDGKYDGKNRQITLAVDHKADFVFGKISSLELKNIKIIFQKPTHFINTVERLKINHLSLESVGFSATASTKTKAVYGILAHQVANTLNIENLNFVLKSGIDLNFPKGVVSLGGLIGYVGGLIQDANNFLVPYGSANSCVLKNIQANFNNYNLVAIGAQASSDVLENTSNSGYVGGLIGEVRANSLELENIQINNLKKASVSGGDASAAGGIIGFAAIANNVKIEGAQLLVNKNQTALVLESVTFIERILDPNNKPNLAGTGAYIGRLRGSYGTNFSFTNEQSKNVTIDPCACTARVSGNNIPQNTRVFIGELENKSLTENDECVVKKR